MAKIKTGEELLTAAIKYGYNVDDLNNWAITINEQIRARYNANRNLYNYRITDFSNNSLLGASGNHFDTIRLMNRFDKIIENETDPVKKTMGMAVRHELFPELEQIMKDGIIASVTPLIDEVIAQNNVSKEAIDEYKVIAKKADRTITGSEMYGRTEENLKNGEYDILQYQNKMILLQNLICSFSDRKILIDKETGNLHETNKPMSELLERINQSALHIMKAAQGTDDKEFQPINDAEKADFAALTKQVQGMDNNADIAYSNAIGNFKTLESFANMDITPNLDSLKLVLDKNPYMKSTAEEFVKNQQNNSLSFIDTEWGESNIDFMVSELYTDDELKNLKNAGLDPAMGILVDGNPINFNFTANLTLLETAKKKCEIVSKAIQGSKLDVTKFVPDGYGGYKADKIIPIKTDLSMKLERRSLWTMIKQFFGYVVTFLDKVTQANKEVRDYQQDYSRAKTVSTAKRTAEVALLKAKFNEKENYLNKLDLDFYGQVYDIKGDEAQKHDEIRQAIVKDAQYERRTVIKKDGKDTPIYTPISIVKSLDRVPSRVNLAIAFGLSKGYSFEAITANTHEGEKLRSKIGKQFVDVFKVPSRSEFAANNGFQSIEDDIAVEEYRDHILNKIHDVQETCAKSCEEFAKLPIPKLDPFNLNEFIENAVKFDKINKMAKDISQAYETISINSLAPTDPFVDKTVERGKAVFDFASTQLEPTVKLGMAMDTYLGLIKSESYINPDYNNLDVKNVHNATRAKATISYFDDHSENIHTVADLNKNEDIKSTILTLGFFALSEDPNLTAALAQAEMRSYIPLENKNDSTVVIDTKKQIFNTIGIENSYSAMYNITTEYDKTFNMGAAKLTERMPVEDRDKPFSEILEILKKYDDADHIMDKQSRLINAVEEKFNKTVEIQSASKTFKEKISFTELTEEKTVVNTTSKEPSANEKTVDIGGKTK